VRPGYASEVVGQLLELGIEPGRLCLEITESQMMEQPDVALEALTELMAADVRIAIDDFGTGFSSMTYLRDLPAQILKVDKLFVDGLPHERRDVAVVSATIQLAHSLGMQVVAEGVETVEQLELLRKLGSDFAQGYLLGRPVPAEEVVLGEQLLVGG
jgi:EAL domain-containing protein (putative c-di-GMP-specific phosphodiesterase class I)